MKYLFFDIECADGGKGTICSFGYIVADMNFRPISREDIVINPQGRFYLKGRAGRPDVQLAYPMEAFKNAPTFPHFYKKIKSLIENEEYYVIGHSVGDDVTYLNKACARYRLEPLCFRYFDTQKMYREIMGNKQDISLENAIVSLGIEGRIHYHKSVADAEATMLLLKDLLVRADMSFESYMASNDRCTGKTEQGKFSWDYVSKTGNERRSREHGLRGERNDNVMLRGRRNHTLFLRYLDFGEAIGKKSDKLAGKKVSISMNYETKHFKEMIILVGMIKAAGGEYVLKASDIDIFATFESVNEEGEPRRCSRGEYVQAKIDCGKNIEVITLEELLERLDTDLEALEAASPIDIEYLLDKKYKR